MSTTPELALSLPKVELQRRGASFGDLTEAEWRRLGPKAAQCQDDLHFFLGDWLNYGRAKMKEWRKCTQEKAISYADAAAKTSFAYGTLRNCAWVCKSVVLSRRRDNLSFAHHQEVAGLKPTEQEDFLDRAEKSEWSVSDLRCAIRRKDSAVESGEKPTDFPTWIMDALRWLKRQKFEDWSDARRRKWRDETQEIVAMINQGFPVENRPTLR